MVVPPFAAIVVRAFTLVAVLVAGAPGATAADLPPSVGDPDWHIPYDAGAARAATSRPDVLALDAAIARLRSTVTAGGWAALPADFRATPGSRNPGVPALRARLRASGDYPVAPDDAMSADTWLFDGGLKAALERFQSRHGLPATGQVEARDLAELNIGADARLMQLMATRTRRTWLPADLGRRHVLANVPASTLTIVDEGRVTGSMRTVVGHPDRPTPSFVAPVTRVVFSPEWSVPRRIAVEDLLPRQQADPTFFRRLGVAVLDGRGQTVATGQIPWSQLSAERFPYRLVQAPGPANSLGRVKLALANPYDIYLHDTPSRLFGLTYRTLGSGCIRLEDPATLVTWLLAAERPWTADDTAARLAGPSAAFALRASPPVWVLYLTSWVDADGTPHFRRDVYGRDARLAAHLPD